MFNICSQLTCVKSGEDSKYTFSKSAIFLLYLVVIYDKSITIKNNLSMYVALVNKEFYHNEKEYFNYVWFISYNSYHGHQFHFFQT
jgi:hypothetical protein